MSTADPTTSVPRPPAGHPARRRVAAGLVPFAGMLMVVSGVVDLLTGVAALVDIDLQGSVYALDLTTWGWIHVVLGVPVALAGAGVIAGMLWGQVAGFGLVALTLIANILFLPYSPWWSLLMIALDVTIIWALATLRPDEAGA